MNDLAISEVVEKVTNFISKEKDHFIELNTNSLNKLDFAKECEFAKQLLMKNDFTLNTARLNPDSLHNAISNVAAIGVSLNPALAYAYLVPRKKEICLDISYRGLIKLATDTGTIRAIKAELIYEDDEFQYHGFHERPSFKANPFGERGALIGVYAMALLTDGGVLVETMSIDEVNQIRDDSEAYKSVAGFSDPSNNQHWKYLANVWVKYYTEMVKKTVIKRAFKTLPPSKGTEILGHAIDVVNEHEGIEFNKPEQIERILYTDEELNEYQRCIDEGDYFNLISLKNSIDPEAQIKLFGLCMPEPEKGKKGAQKNEFAVKLKEAQMNLEATINLIVEALDASDDPAFAELWEGCSQWTKDFISKQLTTEQLLIINEISEAA